MCRLAAALTACALLAATAPAASAVVVHTHKGRFFGLQLHRGVAPSSIPGSVAAAQGASRPRDTGQLSDHGGPVLHSSAPYLIFWVGSSDSIASSSQALMERYFTDVAADSGRTDDVYGVSRQYTDGGGFADYRQMFSPATQALVDTQPYPPTDTANCSGSPCVTDTQLQAELQRLVVADGLPNDGAAGATELPQSAPVYFIVLPGDVNVCASGLGCATTTFCAYHSSLTDASNNTLLYAAMPILPATGSNPKSCQSDGNTAIQEPNGDPADMVVDDMSHEYNETLTDPLGSGWYDPISGNEEGDNCSAYASTPSPPQGLSPNAYQPTLGGSAGAGTLYDQLINGDPYYTQSEWSNGDGNCEMQPSAGTISPQFSETPAPPQLVGTAITFNPAASTSSDPISSETWDFGDGSAPAFHTSLVSDSHTYTAPGTYTVTLTLVDNRGNIRTTSQAITIEDEPPSASFTIGSGAHAAGQAIAFDGSASSDPDGSINLYSWDFGDGAAGTGAQPSHTYAAPGTYTVALTVTDSDGQKATTSHQLTLYALPVASFSFQPKVPVPGTSIAFDGSASSDPNSGATISQYAWSFGDGANAAGPNPSHTYATPGTYTVTLTVSDSLGLIGSSIERLTVYSPPVAAFGFKPSSPVAGTAASFDAGACSDSNPGATIDGYAWSFGDGARATGPNPSHTYATPGTYTVGLTITDSLGLTDSSTEQIVISPQPPTAAFAVNTPHPAVGVLVLFNGSASTAHQGTISSYAWTFGDGTAAGGLAPAHTYTRAGSYLVSLTVVASSGLSATVSESVVVVRGARIVKIAVLRRSGARVLMITLDGPGALSVGPRRFAIAHAETIRVRMIPTRSQRRRLLRTHRVTVRVPVTFTPQIGLPSAARVTITFSA